MPKKPEKLTGKLFSKDYQPAKRGAWKGPRMSTILKTLLDQPASLMDPTLKRTNLTIGQALGVKLVAIALHPETHDRDRVTALKEIFDRVDGKSIQTLQVQQEEVQPIETIRHDS